MFLREIKEQSDNNFLTPLNDFKLAFFCLSMLKYERKVGEGVCNNYTKFEITICKIAFNGV